MFDGFDDFFDGAVDGVVDDHVVEGAAAFGQLDLTLGQAIAPLDLLGRLAAATGQALQKLIGGWGICVGAPRNSGAGAKQAMEQFRASLMKWEKGAMWPRDFAKNGDHGAGL